MTYADLIKALWRKSGLGVQEYADAIELSKTHLSNILNDQQSGTFKVVRQCLDHADIKIEDCLSLPDENPATREEEEALRLFKTLTGGTRQLALSLLAELSQGHLLLQQGQRKRRHA